MTEAPQEVGTIISTYNTPTSESFRFLLNSSVKKDQFVQFHTDEGLAIARVSEVRKTNRYFMQAESVMDYEREGNSLESMFPVHEWEFLVADGHILGVYDNEGQKRPTFPPSPGKKVYLADENMLSQFLGLDRENGISIGQVLFQNVEAALDKEQLLRKHLAILAKSGAGKSYLASVLLEGLLERPQEHSVGIVVIDPHGEYAGFAEDPTYMEQVKVYGKDEIQFSTQHLQVSDLNKIYNLSAPQQRELGKILQQLKRDHTSFTIEHIEQAIEESDMKSSTKEPLLSHMRNLKELNVFRGYDIPALHDIEVGKMVIIDLSDSISNLEKQVIVDQLASRLFFARWSNKIPPFLFLVEEAHNFAPEQTASSEAVARGMIIKMAREGRKFGASLGLVSQRPVNLSTTALSQCNTHLFLRVTNPYDLKHIEESSEGITPEVRRSIPGLRVGDCIVVGEAVNHPIFVKVREKHSQDTQSGTLYEMTKRFLERQQQRSEDVNAFL